MSASSRVRKAYPSPFRIALTPAPLLAFGLLTALAAPAAAQEEYCPSGTVECGDGCMPSGAVCCGFAGYCNAGESCGADGCLSSSDGGGSDVPSGSTCSSGYECADGSGCCPSGTICGTGSNGCDYNSCCDTSSPPPSSGTCDFGMQECADGCIPSGAVCCGYEGYCDAGEYCTDSGCATDDASEPAPEPGYVECPSGYEQCADRCMPLGAVCCGYEGYCDAGEFCTDTGCSSETDGEPNGACPSNAFACADGSGCCPSGTLCGTGVNDCGVDSCCSPDDPSVPATSLPLFPTMNPSDPSVDPDDPDSPSSDVDGPNTTMEGGFTCASQDGPGCDVKFCANFDTNQGYYESEGARFDCDSASNISGCLQRMADYCALLNNASSPGTANNTSSPSSTDTSSSSDTDYSDEDEDDSACSVAPQRRGDSGPWWVWLTPVAWFVARRRTAPAGL